jgi:hypothetical protein
MVATTHIQCHRLSEVVVCVAYRYTRNEREHHQEQRSMLVREREEVQALP